MNCTTPSYKLLSLILVMFVSQITMGQKIVSGHLHTLKEELKYKMAHYDNSQKKYYIYPKDQSITFFVNSNNSVECFTVDTLHRKTSGGPFNTPGKTARVLGLLETDGEPSKIVLADKNNKRFYLYEFNFKEKTAGKEITNFNLHEDQVLITSYHYKNTFSILTYDWKVNAIYSYQWKEDNQLIRKNYYDNEIQDFCKNLRKLIDFQDRTVYNQEFDNEFSYSLSETTIRHKIYKTDNRIFFVSNDKLLVFDVLNNELSVSEIGEPMDKCYDEKKISYSIVIFKDNIVMVQNCAEQLQLSIYNLNQELIKVHNTYRNDEQIEFANSSVYYKTRKKSEVKKSGNNPYSLNLLNTYLNGIALKTDSLGNYKVQIGHDIYEFNGGGSFGNVTSVNTGAGTFTMPAPSYVGGQGLVVHKVYFEAIFNKLNFEPVKFEKDSIDYASHNMFQSEYNYDWLNMTKVIIHYNHGFYTLVKEKNKLILYKF